MHSKGNHKTQKRPTEWEKIFANEATHKGSISKIHRHLLQLNIKKKKKIRSSRRGTVTTVAVGTVVNESE